MAFSRTPRILKKAFFLKTNEGQGIRDSHSKSECLEDKSGKKTENFDQEQGKNDLKRGCPFEDKRW